MILIITIDTNKCRGLYLCSMCDPVLHMQIELEGGLKISEWARGNAEDVINRCPDKAMILTET